MQGVTGGWFRAYSGRMVPLVDVRSRSVVRVRTRSCRHVTSLPVSDLRYECGPEPLQLLRCRQSPSRSQDR
jgi:hypothetical protein